MFKLRHTLGKTFLSAGLIFLGISPLTWRLDNMKAFQASLSLLQNAPTDPIQIDNSVISEKDKPEDIPSRILMKSAGIDISVKPANVVKGHWEVFADTAGFGLGSATPNETGNSVIFAHARTGLFLNLNKTKVGDEILVFTANKWFSYKVTDIKQVYPNDVSVIKQTDDATLTLFTCTGYADLKRLIVVGKKSST